MGMVDKLLNKPKGNLIVFSAYSDRLKHFKKSFERENYQVTTVLVMAPEFDALRDERGVPRAELIQDVLKEYYASGKPGSAAITADPTPVPAVAAPAPTPEHVDEGDLIERAMARMRAETATTAKATPVPAAPESPLAALMRATRAVHPNRGGLGFPQFAAEADFIVTNKEQIAQLLGEDAPLPSFLLTDKYMARIPGMDGATITDIAKPILPHVPKLLLDEHYGRASSAQHTLDKADVSKTAMLSKSAYAYVSSLADADMIFTRAKELPAPSPGYKNVAIRRSGFVRS